jgi:flagellar hook-basal body complex protein FliE
MNVNAITPGFTPIVAPTAIQGAGQSTAVGGGLGKTFGRTMSDALDSVGALQNAAHASVESFMSGETEEIHKVALDQQRAALSLDLFLQVRNKVVNAYQEIMKMQV